MLKLRWIAFVILIVFGCFLSVGNAEEMQKKQSSNVDIDEIFSEGFDDDSSSELDEIFQDGFNDEKTDPDIDAIFDDGFDDESDTDAKAGEEIRDSGIEKSISFFNPGGSIKLSAVYNFSHKKPETQDEIDWRGVSSLRGDFLFSLNPKFFRTWEMYGSVKGFGDLVYEQSFDTDVWTIRDFENFPSTLLESYRDDIDVGEAYISGTLLKNFDIKFGRQVVIWGKADTLRVADIWNPSDLRFPGILTDIEELRLPVFITRLDYYLGQFSVSGIITHENRFSKYPVYGSDFYPYGRPFIEDIPEDSQYGVAINGTIKAVDLSLYVADFYDDTPAVNLFPSQIKHNRNKLAGAAMGIALSDWLFKAEAAYVTNIEYISTPDIIYNRTDVLLGIEYYGFQNTVILIEALDRHINNYDERLVDGFIEVDKDGVTCVLGVTRSFMDELLNISLSGIAYGLSAQNGSSEMAVIEYSITDAFTIGCGVILFQAGDLKDIKDIGYNDRVFFNIRYRF